jgi:hypothetical protein
MGALSFLFPFISPHTPGTDSPFWPPSGWECPPPNYPPVVENVTHSPFAPEYFASVSVDADVIDATLDTVLLAHRVDAGEWVDLVMEHQGGNTFNAVISPQTYGSFIEYYITANDTFGLCTTALNGSIYFNYTVGDTVPPEISDVSHSPSTVTEYDLVAVSAQVIDVGAGVDTVLVYYRSDGGAWAPVSMSYSGGDVFTGPLPPFEWGTLVEYYINASDNAGNIAVDDNSGGYYQYVIDDTTPPDVDISDPLSATILSGVVTILFSSTDSESGVAFVELYLDDVLLTNATTDPFSYVWDTTETADGQHTLRAVAHDNAGNIFEDTTTVIVNNASPPPDAPDYLLITLAGSALFLATASVMCYLARQRGWNIDFSKYFSGSV